MYNQCNTKYQLKPIIMAHQQVITNKEIHLFNQRYQKGRRHTLDYMIQMHVPNPIAVSVKKQLILKQQIQGLQMKSATGHKIT